MKKFLALALLLGALFSIAFADPLPTAENPQPEKRSDEHKTANPSKRCGGFGGCGGCGGWGGCFPFFASNHNAYNNNANQFCNEDFHNHDNHAATIVSNDDTDFCKNSGNCCNNANFCNSVFGKRNAVPARAHARRCGGGCDFGGCDFGGCDFGGCSGFDGCGFGFGGCGFPFGGFNCFGYGYPFGGFNSFGYGYPFGGCW